MDLNGLNGLSCRTANLLVGWIGRFLPVELVFILYLPWLCNGVQEQAEQLRRHHEMEREQFRQDAQHQAPLDSVAPECVDLYSV